MTPQHSGQAAHHGADVRDGSKICRLDIHHRGRVAGYQFVALLRPESREDMVKASKGRYGG